jgi:hypothetical protein
MPVLEGMCTLKELQEFYSIDDLADMHEAIEIKYHVQNKEFESTQSGESSENIIRIDGSK